MNQKSLTLPLNVRTVLVTTDTASATLGLDTDTIIARAESQYRFVWDVSAAPRPMPHAPRPSRSVRELRFWAREIIAPETCTALELPAVIRVILGDRAFFHPGEVNILLRITRPTRLALGKCGALQRQAGTGFYPRATLEHFLTNRLLNQSVTNEKR